MAQSCGISGFVNKIRLNYFASKTKPALIKVCESQTRILFYCKKKPEVLSYHDIDSIMGFLAHRKSYWSYSNKSSLNILTLT